MTNYESKGMYKELVGSYVRVACNNINYAGYMSYTDFERTILKPALVDESVSNLVMVRLEEDKPTILCNSSIQAINPIRKEHLEEILKYAESKQRVFAGEMKQRNSKKNGVLKSLGNFFSFGRANL